MLSSTIHFKQAVEEASPAYSRFSELTTIQVNMGDLCNQACIHCHVEASPNGKNIIQNKVIRDIVDFIKRNPGLTLDITGGAPEMYPEFKNLVEETRAYTADTIIRTNLTIILEKGFEWLLDFYKKHQLTLIASLPCYIEDNVDKQRGKGTYRASVEAIKKLNQIGYGMNEDLILDLVYNPIGPHLPPAQEPLEKDYKVILKEEFGIYFRKLYTITNMAITRYEQYLKSSGKLAEYQKLLVDHFNPEAAKDVMCRTYISVGPDGKIYNCDFNQALNLNIKKDGKDVLISDFDPIQYKDNELILGDHCFGCTAGSGSSCKGALT